MPRSRNDHLLRELAQAPWWASVLVAVLVYVALRWLVRPLAGANAVLAPLLSLAARNAWWIAAIFLLPLPIALVNGKRRTRLVEGQPSLDDIRALSWRDFERLVGEAYRRQGYRVAEHGGRGSDGGIDLELRTSDKFLAVQCKRWKTRAVGVVPVRELYGAMVGEEAHGAVFVTAGTYTPDAIDFARDKPIKLVDGRQLVELLQGVQRRREAPSNSAAVVSRVPRSDAQGEDGVTCPQCGSAMIRRVAKQGAGAGRAFWGCARFPKCRGTRST